MMTKSLDCARCWASTRVTDEKYFCMFPRCPYKREKDPFLLNRPPKGQGTEASPTDEEQARTDAE